jgi:hypothetical protein
MIRLITAAALLAATMASPSAFAQSTYVHHAFCLKSETTQDCAYDSMAQCLQAKRGNTDTCVVNSPPQNH